MKKLVGILMLGLVMIGTEVFANMNCSFVANPVSHMSIAIPTAMGSMHFINTPTGLEIVRPYAASFSGKYSSLNQCVLSNPGAIQFFAKQACRPFEDSMVLNARIQVTKASGLREMVDYNNYVRNGGRTYIDFQIQCFYHR